MRSQKEKLCLALIALFAFASMCVVVIGLVQNHAQAAPAAEVPAPTVSLPKPARVIEVEKLVEVEKEISSETLEDGLQDMGVLLTGEYWFTEVISVSSVKKLLGNYALSFTESGYVAGYDGVVTAGVDLAKASVALNPEAKAVTLQLPEAQVLNVDIDPASMKLYSEKTGLWNPLSVTDFNSSLVELEAIARQHALEKGLLTRAEANARTIAENFLRGLLPADYTLTVT